MTTESQAISHNQPQEEIYNPSSQNRLSDPNFYSSYPSAVVPLKPHTQRRECFHCGRVYTLAAYKKHMRRLQGGR